MRVPRGFKRLSRVPQEGQRRMMIIMMMIMMLDVDEVCNGADGCDAGHVFLASFVLVVLPRPLFCV